MDGQKTAMVLRLLQGVVCSIPAIQQQNDWVAIVFKLRRPSACFCRRQK